MTPDEAQRRMTDPIYKPMGVEHSTLTWKRVLTIAFIEGDTTTVRAIMCLSSFWKGIGFLLPGTMQRSYFADMTFFPGWVWALIFTAHTIGVLWRFRAGPNDVAGFVVNGYGVLIWFATTALGMMAIESFSPENGMELTVMCFAVVALYRTGDRNDRLSA